MICHNHPTLQVVASSSTGGLAELLLGSVASYLIHHCRRPLAVLHTPKVAAKVAAERPPPVSPPATTSPTLKAEREAASAAAGVPAAVEGGPPPLGSARVDSGHNLLVPVDGSDESLAAVQWTLDNLYKTGGGGQQ